MMIINRQTFCNLLLASGFLNQQGRQRINLPFQDSGSKADVSVINESDLIYKEYSSKVRTKVKLAIKEDPTLAGPLLRFAFHDAAVVNNNRSRNNTEGSNGSIRYEMEWQENRGLSRNPLPYLERLNNEMSSLTPHEISFADVVALAGAAAVEAAGGPHISIKLGRSDVSKADPRILTIPVKGESDRSDVITSLPSAGLDSLGLRIYFKRLGLDEGEFVALMGAHDLGRHVTLTDMPKECLRNLTRICLENAPVSVPFITKNPDNFSNLYFKKLIEWNNRTIQMGEAAFIPTDVDLVVDSGLEKFVVLYADSEQSFFNAFTTAYQKLVDRTATSSDRY